MLYFFFNFDSSKIIFVYILNFYHNENWIEEENVGYEVKFGLGWKDNMYTVEAQVNIVSWFQVGDCWVWSQNQLGWAD